MTRYSLDCPTALVIFKITHEDRAGESGTVIQKQGEVVSMEHDGQALIAVERGDIIHCPVSALHAVTAEIAAMLGTKETPSFIAAEHLTRWFPANPLPFTVKWLSLPEIADLLRSRLAK